MTIIDGKKISEDILNEISLEVKQRTNKGYKTPHLAAILVGEDGPSQTYVNSKINACKEVGFKSSLFKYDNNITEEKLLEEIGKINNDDDIDGFIVQLPLPNSINQENILNCALEEVLELSHVLNHLCLKSIQRFYYYQLLPIKHHDCLMLIYQENGSHEY